MTHNAGNTQTISSNVVLNATSGSSRGVSIGSGSTLNFGGTLTATGGTDTNIAFSGGGTVNLGGNVSGNQIQVASGSTVTLNVNFSVTGGSYIILSDTARTNFSASTTRTVGLGGSSSSAGRAFITTSGVSVGTSSFRGGNNNTTSVLGVDISGGGTGTFTTVQTENSTRTNSIYRISAATNNVLNISTNLGGGTGSGSYYNIQGGGIVRLSGASANTTTVPVQVSGATLEFNKTAGVDALGASVALTINSGGTARWLAANQLNNAINPVLNGGTLDLNDFSDTVGTLDLNANSFLALGSSGLNSISFANSSATDWGSSTLSISGTFVSGASVRFGSDATGLGSGQLTNILIDGFNNVGIDGAGWLTATVIPEPSTFAALAGFGALGFAVSRRRSRSVK